MRVRRLVVPVFAALLLPQIAAAQTTADLFDSTVLQEVRLSVNTRDLAELRANTRHWCAHMTACCGSETDRQLSSEAAPCCTG